MPFDHAFRNKLPYPLNVTIWIFVKQTTNELLMHLVSSPILSINLMNIYLYFFSSNLGVRISPTLSGIWISLSIQHISTKEPGINTNFYFPKECLNLENRTTSYICKYLGYRFLKDKFAWRWFYFYNTQSYLVWQTHLSSCKNMNLKW